MAQVETNTPSGPKLPAIAMAPIEVLVVIVRALLGSMLGISTASIFAVFALVGLADLSLGTAITAVALGMNAMLLSLVTLGNLGKHEDDVSL